MAAIGTSTDGSTILEGPLAAVPAQALTFGLRYPSDGPAPTIDLRFIGFGSMSQFLTGRQRGSLPYGDLTAFPSVKTESAAGPAANGQSVTNYSLNASPEEGLYLAIVNAGGASFSVTVASRTSATIAAATDLTSVIVPYVNSSDRHGILFMVLGCVWYVRNMLNYTMSDAVARAISGLSPWPTPPQTDIDTLISGGSLAGVNRIWLTPPDADDDPAYAVNKPPCIDSSAIRETPPERPV